MEEEKLISIIITTYKRSKEIERAIISAKSQTYKNIEIIVVDDNANDTNERNKTKRVVDKYKEIKYIANKKNMGGALSRNIGVQHAKGEIIAFLDDDDEYTSNKIEEQYKCYLNHKNDNVGLIYSYCFWRRTNGEIIGEIKCDLEGKVLYHHMIRGIAGTSLWFLPKKVLIDIGGFEDTPCKQDFIVILKILAAGYNVYRVPKSLVSYYEHENERISGVGRRNIEGLLKYRNWCRKYYDKLNKKEIKEVEYNFSKELVTLYVINKMRKEARKELINMLKKHPFSKKTLMSVAKYMFHKKYLNWLNRRKNNE